MLKAAWQASHADRVPPRIHNLERLASEAGLLDVLPKQYRRLLSNSSP